MQEIGQMPETHKDEISIFDDMKPLPELYSTGAIFGFAFFASTLFGCILMAINLSQLGKKKDIAVVVLYGVLYVAAVLTFLPKLHMGTGGSLFATFAGAYILRHYFWNKYIGKDTAYNKRSITVPLIIAIVIVGLFTATIFYSAWQAGRSGN